MEDDKEDEDDAPVGDQDNPDTEPEDEEEPPEEQIDKIADLVLQKIRDKADEEEDEEEEPESTEAESGKKEKIDMNPKVEAIHRNPHNRTVWEEALRQVRINEAEGIQARRNVNKVPEPIPVVIKSVGKQLRDYALKSGGIDRDSFLKVSDVMLKGKMPKLSLIPDDTDPREFVFDLMAKTFGWKYTEQYGGFTFLRRRDYQEGRMAFDGTILQEHCGECGAMDHVDEKFKKGKYTLRDGNTGKVIATYNSGAKAAKEMHKLLDSGKYDELEVKMEEVELDEAKPEFEVKYASSKKGPIKVSKFMSLDDAKKFLAQVKGEGMNGIISKGGKPVKEENVDEVKKPNLTAGMECQECGKRFRAKLSTLQYGKTKCPKCKSTDLDFAYGAKNESVADDINEGYQKAVLLSLDDAGIDGHFDRDKVVVAKRDVERAKEVLDDDPDIRRTPKIVGEEVELDEKKSDYEDQIKAFLAKGGKIQRGDKPNKKKIDKVTNAFLKRYGVMKKKETDLDTKDKEELEKMMSEAIIREAWIDNDARKVERKWSKMDKKAKKKWMDGIIAKAKKEGMPKDELMDVLDDYGLVEEVSNLQKLEDWGISIKKEGYMVLPALDKQKYTPLRGMEGPFPTFSGKVLYYDPKAGEYYDRDSDMYISYDQYMEYDKMSPSQQKQMNLGPLADPKSREYKKMERDKAKAEKAAKKQYSMRSESLGVARARKFYQKEDD